MVPRRRLRRRLKRYVPNFLTVFCLGFHPKVFLSQSSYSDSDSDSSDSESDEKPKDKKAVAASESGSDSDSESGSGSESDASDSKKRKADVEIVPSAKKAKTAVEDENPKNLFIGSLSWNIDEDWLRSEFESFGDISAVRIVTDRATGKSKGYVPLFSSSTFIFLTFSC